MAATTATDVFNAWARPDRLLILGSVALAGLLIGYRVWTRPAIAAGLAVAAAGAFAWACRDPWFAGLVFEPDHIAVVLLMVMTAFVVWRALRQAAVNDRRVRQGWPTVEAMGRAPVTTWPHLLYLELVAAVICTVLLVVWSLLIRAPLEPPADPQHVPNPAKAPWYFVGLQELLVYFDPWLAGFVIPLLIVVGLCALPYLDRNRSGNGYYTLRDRPLAITLFLAGFLLLWLVPILVGAFMRGPSFVFFGPFEAWHAGASPPAWTQTDLSRIVWSWLGGLDWAEVSRWHPLRREWPGLLGLVIGFLMLPMALRLSVWRGLYRQMGALRYWIFVTLLAMMLLVPIKMIAHWGLGLRYFVAFPEWSLNL